MSKSVSVVVADDLDGSEDAATVSFSLGGAAYEIDLGPANRARLEEALAPFIEAGRRVPRAGAGRRARPSGDSTTDRAAVRAWARAAGLKVSERGRISREVL